MNETPKNRSKIPYALQGLYWAVSIHVVIAGTVSIVEKVSICAGGNCNFLFFFDPFLFLGSMIAWGIGGDNYTSQTFLLATWIYSTILAAIVGLFLGYLYKKHKQKNG